MSSPTPGPDTLNLWSALATMPEQLAQAPDLVDAVRLPPAPTQGVVVLDEIDGGLAGGVIERVAGALATVPVVAAGPPGVPAFTGPQTLVLVLWPGGDSPAMAHSVDAALRRGARVVVVAAGDGPHRGEQAATSVIAVQTPAPGRAALGTMTAVPLLILERLGVLGGAAEALLTAWPDLARRRDQLASGQGVAAEAARRIGRTFPLVHGPPGAAGLAAWRWVAAINENAKSPCFAASAEQLGGDGLAGFGQAGDVTRQILTLVNLRHPAEPPPVARRFAAVGELLLEVVADVVEIEGRGDSDLARFYDLALIGDVVSLHLAAREQVDPGPVPIREDLRRALDAP